MSGKIKIGIAGEALSVLSNKKITSKEFVRRLKKSVFESAGVCEIRVRLYLWELSGKTRQMITGKTAFLITACCLLATAGILMVWQSYGGIGQGVQVANIAGFESFHRPGYSVPGSIDRSWRDGFYNSKPPRHPRAISPTMPERSRSNFLAKNAIKEHSRIVCSPSDQTSGD